MEVPEIYDKIVTIEASAREPGARSKIAVRSRDRDVDPVGACVGMKGSRVQAVVQELRGEKIDIVTWDNDPARFVCNAIQPAEVSRVIIDAATHTMQLIVNDDRLSLAIGKKGQNVRLASQLTGWRIDIHSESKVREMETRALASLSAIEGITAEAAEALFKQGWRAAREVSRTNPDELVGLPGIADTAAAERVVAAATRTADAEENRTPAGGGAAGRTAGGGGRQAAARPPQCCGRNRAGAQAARGGAGVSEGTAILVAGQFGQVDDSAGGRGLPATAAAPGSRAGADLRRLSPVGAGPDAGAPGVAGRSTDGADSGRATPAGRPAGRGAWLHPSEACLAAAVRAKAFERAFRASVGRVDVETVLERHLGDGQTLTLIVQNASGRRRVPLGVPKQDCLPGVNQSPIAGCVGPCQGPTQSDMTRGQS